jgi:palmitoyltransferase
MEGGDEAQDNLNTNINNINQNNQNQEQTKKKQKRYHGKYFVVIVMVVLVVEYYSYTFHILLPNITKKNANKIYLYLVIFNILVGIMLWAYFITMNTHPGEIPLYWGFYIGDDDYKRKRYCLICNAFKPERSHHCSICNVCILNMDHHCPWVDNCIGFYNRKFFMQLLFYLSILLYYVDFTSVYFVYLTGLDIYHNQFKYTHKFHAFIVFSSFLFVLIFTIVITFFFKFHIQLVLNNSTTIENLDKDNQNDTIKFRLSNYENWVQVFGFNKFYWFIPIFCEAGRPDGDGLMWKINQNAVMEQNARNNNNNNDRSNINENDRSTQNFRANEMDNYGSNNPMVAN